jgi:hypothetical protein
MRTYETQKLRVKRAVQSALSKVHFTVDLWTSPNALAILGIVAHYTSESGQLEYSVLALRELDGKHSGPNMADCLESGLFHDGQCRQQWYNDEGSFYAYVRRMTSSRVVRWGFTDYNSCIARNPY